MTENLGMGRRPTARRSTRSTRRTSRRSSCGSARTTTKDVTGRVFLVDGDRISVAEGWHRGPTARNDGMRWEPAQLTKVVPDLVAQAAEPISTMAS